MTCETLRTLGKLMSAKRRELGLTCREVAGRSGISNAYLSALEHGVNPKTGKPSRPSYDKLLQLGRTLGLGGEAYGLAGYDAPEEVSERTSRGTTLRDIQWEGLLNSYTDELRKALLNIGERRKGEMLEDISILVEKYRPETSYQ